MDNNFEIIRAIEEFVSSSKGVNSPGDSYLNIALALYKHNKGDSADLRIVNIIEQRLPKLLQETPTRLLEKLSVDNGVAIWWCLNSCAHNVYETERVYSCSPSLSRLAVYLADVRTFGKVQIVGRFVPTQELPAISLSYRSLTPLRIKKEAAGLISEDYLLRELFELCSIPAVRTFAILMDYPIPLPPIDEQQRILNEETHRHIGSIKHLLDQSQAHQQRLLSSIRHRILNDLSPIADFSISIKHLLSKSKDGLKANDLVVGDLTLEQALELIYANCMRTLESVSLLKELTEGRSEPIDLNDCQGTSYNKG